MKTISIALAATLAIWASLAIGTAMSADTGVGVCILGTGFSLNDETGAGPYAGVNVGQANSTTGVYDSNESFEEQCCAEMNQPADCFAPVEEA